MDRQLVQKLLSSLCFGLNLTVPSPEELIEYSGCFITNIDTKVPFVNTRLPSELPIIISKRKQLNQADFDEIRLITNTSGHSITRIALLFYLGSDQEINTAITSAKNYGDTYAYNIVLVGRSQIMELLASKNSHTALRRLILSQVNLKTVSPFTINGPTPDNVFFGREKEIHQILENIAKTSFAIIGGRRIGKTSILSHLHRNYLPQSGFKSIYKDCQAFNNSSSLESEIFETIKWPSNSESNLRNSGPDKLNTTRSVILLDEVDKIVPFERENDWFLFRKLRALTNSGHISVVICGERELGLAIRDPNSPFFNFVNEINLGPLDLNAVYELVTQPMKQLDIDLLDENEIIQEIYEFTSGHPNIVQRLCDRLIDRMNQGGNRILSLEDVESVINDPVFQRDDFLGTYWERATPLEKIISLLLAEDQSLKTIYLIKETLERRYELSLRLQEIDDAMQMLTKMRSILRRTEKGYEFTTNAFPRVIAGTMTSNELLDLQVEKYREGVGKIYGE